MTIPAKQNMKTCIKITQKKIRPFSLRISDLLNEIKINTKIVHPYHTLQNGTMDHKATNYKLRTG